MSTPLLGAPFKLEVQRQLQVRSLKRASQNLTDKDLAVQHGSTGWARISSGVIIDNDPTAAKNNILQGGVLNKLQKGFNKTGNNSSYTRVMNITGSITQNPNYAAISAEYILDVTDTSNVKFQVTAQDQHGSGRLFGETNTIMSSLTVMRLGDT